MTIFAGDAPALDRRTLLDIPADAGEVFDASFGSAFNTNPTTSFARMRGLEDQEVGRPRVGSGLGLLPSQRMAPDTPLIDAQAARDQVAAAGLEIKVPDQGIRQGALETLIERQREQLARQQVLARSNGGSMPTQIAAGLAASLMDPLNIASAFIPVVGEARYGALLAGAGGTLGRAGVRVGVGAVEGAVGAAIIEPLPLLAARQDQTEYGLSDTLANIALGGILGGGLHSVGGAVSDALRRRLASETPGAGPAADAAPGVRAELPGGDQVPRFTAADFGRVFEDDPELALRGNLARQLEADQAELYRGAQRQAMDEIRPTLAAERVGNVADLRAERIGLVQRDMNLDATFRDRAKEFQGQRMSRKQAERAARESIGTEREQLRTRQAEIDTALERNRAGEFDRRDLGLMERGEVPERLQPQIQARARQIMAGYQRNPLGAAVRTARDTAEQADWTVRSNALRTAVAQAVSGRDIDVQALFDLEAPGKAASAIDQARRPLARRIDDAGQAESMRIEGDGARQGADDLEQAEQALAEDEALVREMLDQLPEQDRAAVDAAGRDEARAVQEQADRAEQYSKAYRAAAVCDLRRN